MSSKIHERVYVACPSVQARHHLAEFFRQHTLDGDIHLTLRTAPAGGDAIVLDREVVATMTPQLRPKAIEAMSVSWTPNSELYPSFAGTLIAREDERYESFVLELDGLYEPPFGLAGAAFDAVVGRRLARATAQALLFDIARSVEAQYRQCENEKAVKRAAVGQQR